MECCLQYSDSISSIVALATKVTISQNIMHIIISYVVATISVKFIFLKWLAFLLFSKQIVHKCRCNFHEKPIIVTKFEHKSAN